MVILPPPIWALIYLLVMGIVSAVFAWKPILDLTVVPLGVVLVIAGITLMVWASTLFRRLGTELNPRSASNKKLVVEGPFRFTRNPMYLGLVILTLGIAFWVGSLPLFLVPVLIFATTNWGHIPFEEAKMRRQFPAEYDAYTARVRRWI